MNNSVSQHLVSWIPPRKTLAKKWENSKKL